MSTKALKRELLAAIVMLLVAAIALSGSTFAWFAASNEVEATGLNVTAQSDAPNLVISATGADGTFGTSKPADEAASSLYPTAHVDFASASDITNSAKWYYGYSDDKDDATLVVSTKRTLENVTYTSYVAIYTFFVKLDSEDAADMEDLMVSEVSFTGEGVNAIFVGPDGYEEVKAGATPTDVVIANDVTGSANVPVTVYLYVDGNNSATKTTNIDNLKDTISFKLTASQK